MRDLDLATLQPPASYAGLWTDYARDTAYGDYTLSPGASGPEATTIARYQPGAWERQGDALRVHHGDQIGSGRVMTHAAAQPARRAVYTAFGEPVPADDGQGGPPATSRYGYAGAWGYETGLDDGGEPDLPPLPFTHVGERWYDPSAGRFLQRDPIGIAGGMNVFLYVEHAPVLLVDPSGEGFWDGSNWFHEWVAESFWMNVHDTQTLAGMSDLRAGAEAVGVSVVAGAGGYFGGKYLICRIKGPPGWKGRVRIKWSYSTERGFRETYLFTAPRMLGYVAKGSGQAAGSRWGGWRSRSARVLRASRPCCPHVAKRVSSASSASDLLPEI